MGRIESVAPNPLCGAIPCDNNALEAGNAADKESLVYKKSSLFNFVGSLDRNIIAPASCQDTLFEGQLKGRLDTQRLNLAVYNIKYFEQCRLVEKANMKGKPTFLFMTFKYTAKDNNVPEGSFLIADRHCLTEIQTMTGVNEDALCTPSCPAQFANIKPQVTELTNHFGCRLVVQNYLVSFIWTLETASDSCN